jgi:MFS family permease
VIRGLELVASGPFARATLTNFFFMSSLSCFILLPLYVHRLGGTEAEIGLVQGVDSAAGILCQPVIGLWLDRIGRRFFMALGVSLLIASSAAFLVSHSLALLAALRVVQGLGFSAFFVANYMHVVDLVPAERRGWALGIYGVSGFLGTALAPVAGEIMVRRLGFPWLFVLSVLLGGAAAWLVATTRGIRPPSMGEGPGIDSLRAGACRGPAPAHGARLLFRTRDGRHVHLPADLRRGTGRPQRQSLLHCLCHCGGGGARWRR